MSKIKERILQFASNEGVSYTVFAQKIGMSYSSFTGDAKKRPINSDAISKILSIYSKLNPMWLILGKGNMILTNDSLFESTEPKSIYQLRTDTLENQQKIPLYNIEASAGLIPLFENPNQNKTDEYITIPRVPKCDGAVSVTGDSMYPLLKSGDIIAYKKINDFKSEIFWGEMYLISVEMAGEEFIAVKWIHKGADSEHIKLVSENRHFESKEVRIDKIRAMALVKASIRINSMG